jgi:hypothetical protein
MGLRHREYLMLVDDAEKRAAFLIGRTAAPSSTLARRSKNRGAPKIGRPGFRQRCVYLSAATFILMEKAALTGNPEA